MKHGYLLIGLLLYTLFSIAQKNIVSYGVPDSIFAGEHANLIQYRSQINYPPFISWSTDGGKMLFNGEKAIYSMKSYKSEIKEHLEADQACSSKLSPHYEYFLHQEDEGGDENYQLFLYNIASGYKSTAVHERCPDLRCLLESR